MFSKPEQRRPRTVTTRASLAGRPRGVVVDRRDCRVRDGRDAITWTRPGRLRTESPSRMTPIRRAARSHRERFGNTAHQCRIAADRIAAELGDGSRTGGPHAARSAWPICLPKRIRRRIRNGCRNSSARWRASSCRLWATLGEHPDTLTADWVAKLHRQRLSGPALRPLTQEAFRRRDACCVAAADAPAQG